MFDKVVSFKLTIKQYDTLINYALERNVDHSHILREFIDSLDSNEKIK